MKKKIAIFQVDLSIGGIEKSLINFLNHLDPTLYEIDLYLLEEGKLINEVPKYVNVMKLKHAKFLKYVPFNMLKILERNNIKKEYDIAIDYNGYNSITAVSSLKVKSSKKIIWVHNDYKLKMSYERKFRVLFNKTKAKFKYFDEIVCVSNGAKESFDSIIPNDKTIVIPNFINTKEIISKSKEKINFNVLEDKYNFCCLGRMCYQKGYDILLPYIKELLNKRRDIHLYFIGDGKDYIKIQNKVKELGLTSYVTFLGAQTNPYPYLNKMDALLFNSRYEGQGIVLLEALCLGLDIAMPKHLEKYCDYIKGTDDLILEMSKLKKKKKKVNDLETYNQDISSKIKGLLGE